MEKSERKILIAIVLLLFAFVFVGSTLAFFNYTRTGTDNTIRTGHITFLSSQDDTISLSNMFPVSSSEALELDDNTVTIDISGATSYLDGEEYVVTFTDVNARSYGKNVPLSFTATYEPAANKTIGTSSDDYWNNRNDKDSNIYSLTTSGFIKENREVLVGYIDNEGNGIDGTLTINAFIDKDRIAITDTYPSGVRYVLNPNMNEEELDYCIDFYWNQADYYYLDTEEEVHDYCAGTGLSSDRVTNLQYTLNYIFEYYEEEEIDDLLEHGVIMYTDNGTTSEWINDRIYFTTSEWNDLANNPVSFKIKVESNEGIWYEKPTGTIDSCPDCKFFFPTSNTYTTWNTSGETPSIITEGLYDSYLDLIYDTNIDYFIGAKLNSNNQVTNVYVCGLKNNIPFCLETADGDSKYESNKELLQSTNLWNNTCDEIIYSNSSKLSCVNLNATNSEFVIINSFGFVVVGLDYDVDCWANQYGRFSCDFNLASAHS